MSLFLTPLQYILQYVPILVVIWLAGSVVYRLYFHPLAHIPGPRVAAATYLYGFYFNAISASGSRFYLQIEKLHKKYGPVVRITPNEVHLSDPDNYDTIYHVGTKYYKSPEFYRSFGLETASFGIISNEQHRVRRAALNPRFSRKTVLENEDLIQSKVWQLCRRMTDMFHANKPVDLHHGFRAVSIDVITDYAFNNCYNLLDKADFGLDYFTMVRSLTESFWIFNQFPLLQFVALKSPMWLAKSMNKHIGSYLQMRQNGRDQVASVKATIDQGKPPKRMTVFHQLLHPDAAEGHVVPSVEELVDEAFTIIGAASETTGNALTIATYHILANEKIYSKLKAELKGSFPNPSSRLDFVELEKLPYLTGVIKEGLRLSYGVISRLPRVTPLGDKFNGFTIPPGSAVGMSSWMMHRNEEAFPMPDKFDPERWLDPASARRLEKHLVVFSKGTRQCVGMNLAYCELYVTLGTVFRQFEHLEAYNIGPEDYIFDDYFSPFPTLDARKLQATLRKS